MPDWGQMDLLMDLYKKEYKKLTQNEYYQASQKATALEFYKETLLEIRDFGLDHDNKSWMERMQQMVQQDLDKIHEEMEILKPVLEKANTDRECFSDYHTRLKKLEGLGKLLREKFGLLPQVTDTGLSFKAGNFV